MTLDDTPRTREWLFPVNPEMVNYWRLVLDQYIVGSVLGAHAHTSAHPQPDK